MKIQNAVEKLQRKASTLESQIKLVHFFPKKSLRAVSKVFWEKVEHMIYWRNNNNNIAFSVRGHIFVA